MKKALIFLSLTASLLLSCKKDPWTAVEKGDWNNDHNIIEIKFAGQAGLAKVEDKDAETGVVKVQLASFLIEDKSKVEVEKIITSYKAECNIKSGDFMDFTGDSPTIVVKSPTGLSRTYTVDASDFSEELLGCYSIKGSYVWGGTGNVYGGAAMLTPESKDWCWNARDGYGPKAEYDDYLEFTFEEITAEGNVRGKCVHYGGVDGKHWNGIYAAKMNKEGKTDIDLRKFYRQIPLGESSWLRNYSENTITFTDKNGITTVGSLLEKGEHIIGQTGSNGNDVKDKTFDFQFDAFQFKLQGTDDWTNIYSDYDKFVKKPRTFFVLIEKVASIPDEAKTEGSEGDTSIDEPEPEPEPTLDIAGEWKVKSLNVYGGSDSPAFVKPTDKSWCFSNVGAESDNILKLTPSESNPLEGTADYTPGADGKYWNYIFLAKFNKEDNTKDVDCSKFYGWLPHGESKYVISVADMTISFKSGAVTYTVPVILAGDHKYGEKSLNVPSGCIGLDYPCGGVKGNSSYYYTDYDRFAVCPINYVMVFEKQ